MVTMLKPRISATPDRITTSNLRPNATERTRGSAWMKTRDRILTRDKGICRCSNCKATGALKRASEVDHVTPLWEGGTDDDSNLQAINVDCHAAKTAAEAKRRAKG